MSQTEQNASSRFKFAEAIPVPDRILFVIIADATAHSRGNRQTDGIYALKEELYNWQYRLPVKRE